jgi:hypothetical protein
MENSTTIMTDRDQVLVTQVSNSHSQFDNQFNINTYILIFIIDENIEDHIIIKYLSLYAILILLKLDFCYLNTTSQV